MERPLQELDLDVAVALVNSSFLAHRDGLTDAAVSRRILTRLGDHDLVGELSERDLPALRALSADLAPVFDATTVEEAVSKLDPLLRDASVPARLAAGPEGAYWNWGHDQRGTDALRARVLTALGTQLIRHGIKRIGVCQADPCRCVFVDRSRARTRRYCCDQCNDRASATAYRKRQD